MSPAFEPTIKILESADSYLAALDNHAIVSVTDANGCILAANDKFCEISGYLRDELLGQNHRLLNSGLHSREFFEAMYHKIMSGQVWHGEIRNRAKDGSYYWVQASITPIFNSCHELYRYISIRTDITTQKNAEMILAERSRIMIQMEKMHSLGLLAAGVAHEINNPIGFVNSNLGTLARHTVELIRFAEFGAVTPPGKELLKEVDLEFLRTDLRDLLAESIEGVHRVRRIVQNLKEFTNVDEYEWQEVDLIVGLEQAVVLALHEVKSKVQIVRKLTPLPCVKCAPAQINQVFLNILVNAAQAIDGKGVITLRCGISGEMVWIEIADTGCGMNEATQQKVFDLFFTTKPVGIGTGLGMSSSWDIVHKHDGRIEVASAPGHGSCFRISLPILGPARSHTM